MKIIIRNTRKKRSYDYYNRLIIALLDNKLGETRLYSYLNEDCMYWINFELEITNKSWCLELENLLKLKEIDKLQSITKTELIKRINGLEVFL